MASDNENTCPMEDEEEMGFNPMVQVLNMLNLKVSQRCPLDCDWNDDTSLRTTEKEYYAKEVLSLMDAVDFWKSKAVSNDNNYRAVKKSLTKCERNITTLKRQLANKMGQNAKLREQLKLRVSKTQHKKEMSENHKTIKNLKSLNLAYFVRLTEANERILAVETEARRSNEMMEKLEEENVLLNRRIESNALVHSGIMEEKQKELENMKCSYKIEMNNLQSTIVRLESLNSAYFFQLTETKEKNQGMETEASQKNELIGKLEQENSALIKQVERITQMDLKIMEEQQKELENMKANHKNEIENLQSTVASLEGMISGKEAENRLLTKEIKKSQDEKNHAVYSWKKLKKFVKNCGDDLESNINSFISQHPEVQFPSEKVKADSSSSSTQGEEGVEHRLKRNLGRLSQLVRDTLLEFLGKKGIEDESDNEPTPQPHVTQQQQQQPSSSSAITRRCYDDLPNDNNNDRGEGPVADDCDSQILSSPPLTPTPVLSEYEPDSSDLSVCQQLNADVDPYLPVCSPISSDGGSVSEDLPAKLVEVKME